MASSTDFETAINETIDGGGSVLIPAFAVDRTEIILVRIRELMEAGTIRKVTVFADSPMALKALNYYRQAINEGSAEIRKEIIDTWAGRDPFDPGSLVELETVEQSKTVNDPSEPCIIISASGMGTGGRVVHHLRQMLPNAKHTVLFVGYQAIGTRGRSLVDGAEQVKMHGEMVPVRARVEQIAEFSVHADSNELIEWLRSTSVEPGQVFVVHGEGGVAESFSDSIVAKLGWKSKALKDGEEVLL